jgi:hypothetical protein
MKKYLCVVDVMPSGQIAAIEVEATDALMAERTAMRTGRDRYGCVEVLEVIRTDVINAA